MKKQIIEEKVFCDFCEREAHVKCLVCGKDLCSSHMLTLVVRGISPRGDFQVYLGPEDAKPLLPVLKSYHGKSAWENSGHNAEFNEARLNEIIGLLEVWHGIAGSGT